MKCIIYTDGSAGPGNPGPYGWGAHGYVYEETGKTNNRPTGFLVTDKGYIDNAQKDLIKHDLVNPIEYLDYYGTHDELGTNNAAELAGIFYSLIHLERSKKLDEITVFTDSQYCLDVINKNIEDITESVPNNILISNIINITSKFKNNNVVLNFNKIKGHSKHLGNDRADKLANLGRLCYINNDIKDNYIESVPKGYFKPIYDKHAFMPYNTVYYMSRNSLKRNTEKPIIDKHPYITLKYKREIDIGRKMTGIYGFMLLNKPIKIIENIKESYNDLSVPYSTITAIKLSNVFNAENYFYINNLKDKNVYTVDKTRTRLSILNSKDSSKNIALQVNPPSLAYVALDRIEDMKIILLDYYNYSSNKLEEFECGGYKLKNINDLIYETNGKGKNVIRKDIPSNSVDFIQLKMDSNNGEGFYKVNLTMGEDILPRNSLKNIENDEPIINLIYKEEENMALRYYVIIECVKTGDTSIWTNFFSNVTLKLFK